MKIYQIYDTKAEVFSLPIFYDEDLYFRRSLISMGLQEPSSMNFLCDNEYYCIGSYDNKTGEVIITDKVKVFTGFDILQEIKQTQKQIGKKNGK